MSRRWWARSLVGLPLALPLRLRSVLLILLPNYWVLRLIAVLVALYRLLLSCLGISVARVLPLVNRQRGGSSSGAAVPPVPSAPTLLPFMIPALAPAGRRIGSPPGPGRRRLAIVAHGYPQDERRHALRAHQPPGPVARYGFFLGEHVGASQSASPKTLWLPIGPSPHAPAPVAAPLVRYQDFLPREDKVTRVPPVTSCILGARL